MQTNTFWLNFGGLYLAVTLKIRSRSPKPIQLFIMSKCYIHANLVKVRQLVHETLCTQAPFGSNLAVEVLQWPWKIGRHIWPSLHKRMCRTWVSNLGPLACQEDMLPIELCIVLYTNRICTKSNMAPSPSVGNIINRRLCKKLCTCMSW